MLFAFTVAGGFNLGDVAFHKLKFVHFVMVLFAKQNFFMFIWSKLSVFFLLHGFRILCHSQKVFVTPSV